MVRKLLAMLLVIAALGMSAASAETLRVGMECNYAPYNWMQAEESPYTVKLASGGYADGYDVQIARYLADKLGMELEIVKYEWDGLPIGLTSGKIDAVIAGMSPTAERRLTIDFTAPYYETDLVVVVRKDGPYANARSLDDLKGARITGQLGTLHYTVIDQIPGVRKQTALETFPAMVVALESGRIDGYVSERPSAEAAMFSNPSFAYTAFDEGKGFAVSVEDKTVSVGLRKGSPLLDRINGILAELDGETRNTMMVEAITRQPLNQ